MFVCVVGQFMIFFMGQTGCVAAALKPKIKMKIIFVILYSGAIKSAQNCSWTWTLDRKKKSIICQTK